MLHGGATNCRRPRQGGTPIRTPSPTLRALGPVPASVAHAESRKSSPSRWRFCPLSPLTFRFRVRPSGGASTYSRSELGASRNLQTRRGRVKTVRQGITALCDVSRTEPLMNSTGYPRCSSISHGHVGPSAWGRRASVRLSNLGVGNERRVSHTSAPTPLQSPRRREDNRDR